MKKVAVIILILSFFACSKQSKQSVNNKYLELTEIQLKDIGFVINENGVFFKTEIPADDKISKLEYIRGYLNTPYDQGTHYNMNPDRPSHEELLKKIEHPGYYDSLPAKKCDYYFVKIVEINGSMICSVEPHKAEVIPLIVRQSKYNFKIKKDIIVYLKASKGLQEKLKYVENLDQYIVNLND